MQVPPLELAIKGFAVISLASEKSLTQIEHHRSRRALVKPPVLQLEIISRENPLRESIAKYFRAILYLDTLNNAPHSEGFPLGLPDFRRSFSGYALTGVGRPANFDQKRQFFSI